MLFCGRATNIKWLSPNVYWLRWEAIYATISSQSITRAPLWIVISTCCSLTITFTLLTKEFIAFHVFRSIDTVTSGVLKISVIPCSDKDLIIFTDSAIVWGPCGPNTAGKMQPCKSTTRLIIFPFYFRFSFQNRPLL